MSQTTAATKKVPKEFIDFNVEAYQNVVSLNKQPEDINASLMHDFGQEFFLTTTNIKELWTVACYGAEYPSVENYIAAKFKALEVSRGLMDVKDEIPDSWYKSILSHLVMNEFNDKTLQQITVVLNSEEEKIENLRKEIEKMQKFLKSTENVEYEVKNLHHQLTELDKTIEDLENQKKGVEEMKSSKSLEIKNEIQLILSYTSHFLKKYYNYFEIINNLRTKYSTKFTNPYLFGNHYDVIEFMTKLNQILKNFIEELCNDQEKIESIENIMGDDSFDFFGKIYQLSHYHRAIEFFSSFKRNILEFFAQQAQSDAEFMKEYESLMKKKGLEEFDLHEYLYQILHELHNSLTELGKLMKKSNDKKFIVAIEKIGNATKSLKNES